jgi:hypothetical protein
MSYILTTLHSNLVYIELTANPTPIDYNDYVRQVNQILKSATEPVYFLVDFRQSITSNVSTIRRLAELTKHRNFGASIAFSSDHVRQVYANLFAALAAQGQSRNFYQDAQAAIDALEALKPGLTTGVDWQAVLGKINS